MPYKRPIVRDGDAVLRKVAKRVRPEELRDPLFQQLIDDMFVTMYEAPGIGLAAPQVGVSKRLFTIDIQDKNSAHGPFVVVNPKWELREGEEERHDGCLSVPGYVGETVRFTHVAITGLDRNGEKIRLEGDGLFAHCIQHEIDHLDGILYTDSAKNVRPAEPDDEENAEPAGDEAAPGEVSAEVERPSGRTSRATFGRSGGS